jgi:hypothetical protein
MPSGTVAGSAVKIFMVLIGKFIILYSVSAQNIEL